MSPPAILRPPWQGDSPKSLSPGTQPLAQVSRNTSGTWLSGLGSEFSACLWQCGSAEHPSPCPCLSWEKSPATCPAGSCSLVPHPQLNNKNHAVQGKSTAEETEQKEFSSHRLTKSSPYTDSQILANPQSLTYELGKFYFLPLFIGLSSNESSLGAVLEKDKVGLSQ